MPIIARCCGVLLGIVINRCRGRHIINPFNFAPFQNARSAIKNSFQAVTECERTTADGSNPARDIYARQATAITERRTAYGSDSARYLYARQATAIIERIIADGCQLAVFAEYDTR